MKQEPFSLLRTNKKRKEKKKCHHVAIHADLTVRVTTRRLANLERVCHIALAPYHLGVFVPVTAVLTGHWMT